MSTSPTGLHALLRAATKAPHRQLDHHPILTPLLRTDLTKDEYARALAALHGVYSPAEVLVRAFFEMHPDTFEYRGRWKSEALEDDLADLGFSSGPATVVMRAPGCIAELVGMLYPLEGSTLGGQVIARQIRSLGAGRFPLRFFEAYGGYVLPRWNEFLAWSEASCPAEDHARAIKAAVAMFGVIRAHFDECYGRTNPVSGEIYSDSV